MSINIKVKNITEEQYIKEYDIDLCGDVDVYNSNVCPCVMCMEENING